MITKGLKIGADPEGFLWDGNQFINAHGLFAGTKEDPFPVEKGFVQVDGMAVEYNIEPAEDEETFSKNNEIVKAQLQEIVSSVAPGVMVIFSPIANFAPEYFKLQGTDGKILGCSPDYDHKGKQKAPGHNLQDRPFRTAAGHIHIGWTENQKPMDPGHFEDCRMVAERFLNVRGFIPVTPEERQRTTFYGQPGSFRPKKYGVELRAPSNLWVRTPKAQKAIFRATMRTMEKLFDA